MAPPNRIPGVRVAQADENYSPPTATRSSTPSQRREILKQNFPLMKKIHQQILCAEGKEALEFALDQLQEKQKAARQEFIKRFEKWKESSCFVENMRDGVIRQVANILGQVEPGGIAVKSLLAVVTSGAAISESPHVPATGTIRGRVRDARTHRPIKDALIEFGRNAQGIATSDDGSFESYPFPPGDIEVEVRKEGYKPAQARVRVNEGLFTKIDVLLAPATPPTGTVGGQVVDENEQGIAANVTFEGPVSKSISIESTGKFSEVKLPPGEYVVKYEAPGHLKKNRPLSVRAGEKYGLDVTLRRSPYRWTARLATKQIVINRQITFQTGEGKILHESYFVLDQVADILLKNLHLKIQIEGHLDNAYAEQVSQKLSEDRADSVKAYLVQAGVSSDRLETVGYGSKKPLVPNFNERNRARNRRIVFNILQ